MDGLTIDMVTSAPYSTTWNTVNLIDGAYVISATATDTIGQSPSDSVNVIVDNVSVDPAIHIGDLDGSSALAGRGGKWDATVSITVHDENDTAVSGATVTGAWSLGATGTGSCITNVDGVCSITKSGIKRNTSSATFSVSSVADAGSTYQPGDNHDPDGDSNGTDILITNQ